MFGAAAVFCAEEQKVGGCVVFGGAAPMLSGTVTVVVPGVTLKV
jgi:hypothetical protein